MRSKYVNGARFIWSPRSSCNRNLTRYTSPKKVDRVKGPTTRCACWTHRATTSATLSSLTWTNDTSEVLAMTQINETQQRPQTIRMGIATVLILQQLTGRLAAVSTARMTAGRFSCSRWGRRLHRRLYFSTVDCTSVLPVRRAASAAPLFGAHV